MRILLTVAFLMCGTIQLDASLLTNGGFEEDVISDPFKEVGNGQLTGWTVSKTVGIVAGYWNSYEGDQSLDLNGLEPGTISQTFATIVGATYSVSFAYANNTDAIQLYGAVPTADMYVFDAGNNSLLHQFLTHSTSTPHLMDYTIYTGTFVATTATSTIEFVGGLVGPCGIAIDDVQVNVAVPEPATLTIWGLGFLGCAVAAYRRRRIAA